MNRMISRPVNFSPLLTRTKGEQLYLHIVRPLSTDLRARAQTGSTEPFSTASSSPEDHNDGYNDDDDDGDDYDDDDDVSLESFAVHA